MASEILHRINARAQLMLSLDLALDALRSAEKEATRENSRAKALLGPGYRWNKSRGMHPGRLQKEVERLAKEVYLLRKEADKIG